MYQTLPSAEYYTQFERQLVKNGERTSLSLEELAQEQITTRFEEGYKTYTGYQISQVEAESLNKYIDELNRTRCLKTREYFKDRKHQLLVIIAEQMTPSQIREEDNKVYAIREEQARKKAA